MTPTLDEALAVIQQHLENYMHALPEDGASVVPGQVVEALQWMSAANYGAAVHLTRLQKGNAELVRQDGKDIGIWIVEQVRLGNIARSTRIDYQKRQGLPMDD